MSDAQVYNALTIADEILRIAKRNGEFLTPMKLMKLTYIAHGWSLALLNRDLFRNRIEAWQYGPVIPDLYQATKIYGRVPIPPSKINDAAPSNVDIQVRALLEEVWAKYGGYDAIALSNMTHMSGTPWDIVYKPGRKGIEISDELIKSHYKDLASGRRAA